MAQSAGFPFVRGVFFYDSKTKKDIWYWLVENRNNELDPSTKAVGPQSSPFSVLPSQTTEGFSQA